VVEKPGESRTANWDRGVALTSRLQSFETELLAEDTNFAGLVGLSRVLIAKAERWILGTAESRTWIRRRFRFTESKSRAPTMGTIYYHPLLLFNRDGDCLAARLRPGNVHSAEGWDELLLPEIERQ